MSGDPFVISDDRYSRFHLIAWWNQEKIRAAKILVVGAGALGNEVLKNLALMGIGEIFVIDFDLIESSNLTRSVLYRASDCGKTKSEVAAEATRSMNPECQVIPIHGNVMSEIGLGIVKDVDVVIGCLDNREARLWVNRMCWKVNTPWVDGGIQEINGVVKTFIPPNGSCYECGMTENDYRLINLRYSCPMLKQEDILEGKVPTAPTISSIVGGMQTQEALKLIHKLPVAEGAAHVFNGQTNQLYTTRFQRNEDCLSHETYGEAVRLPIQAKSNTASDLFAAAREHFLAGDLELRLDRDLITDFECAPCGIKRDVMKSMYDVSAKDSLCEQCGEGMRPNRIHVVHESDSLASRTLNDIGIPSYDILNVGNRHESKWFLLDGDRETVYA